jgi:preprotein translocase subunit SecB
MEDKPHPISLLQVFFTRTVVLSVPDHEITEDRLHHPAHNNIELEKVPETENRYAVTMRTIVNADQDNSDPYFIDMECIGVFEVSTELSEEDARRGVTITAHNVLYGAIRECTSWLTGRHAYGNLTLGLSVLKKKSNQTDTPPPELPAK